MTYLNGHYTVNSEIIANKVYAILKASETNSPLAWHYYDEIFSSTIITNEITLVQLYKERAQQLRDKYDYLILNYSGGSDSHNVLHTFLSNNIKLDHIFVQWPEKLMDRGIYVPNAIDKSNANFHSEWDIVLKKDLEWIGKHYPEITIEIADWTDTVNERFYTDDLFLNNVSNLPSIARAQKQNTFSPIESKLTSAGNNVGSIFGVDKSNVVKKGNNWFFYFVDTGCMAHPNPDNPVGTEYFYWSPDFPRIAVLQAHKMVSWFKQNPTKQYLVQARSERSDYANLSYSQQYTEYHEISEIAKLVCYPYWDFRRFQAAKPFSQLDNLAMGVRAWDNILSVLPNFQRSQQAWEYNWKSYLSKIDKRFLRSDDTVMVCKSKWHFVCNDQ
jgi:hypothetical protein